MNRDDSVHYEPGRWSWEQSQDASRTGTRLVCRSQSHLPARGAWRCPRWGL